MDLEILRLVQTLTLFIFSTVCADICPSAEWKEDEESRMCYLFSEHRQTFIQAVDICKKHGTHLLQYEEGVSKQTIRKVLNVEISEIWIEAPATPEGDHEINVDQNMTTDTILNVSTETIPQVRYRLLPRSEENCRVINVTNDKEVIVSKRCTIELPFICEKNIRHLERSHEGMRDKVLAAIIVGVVIGVIFLVVIVKTCHKRLKLIERGEYSMVGNKRKKEDEMVLQKSDYTHIGQPDTRGDTNV